MLIKRFSLLIFAALFFAVNIYAKDAAILKVEVDNEMVYTDASRYQSVARINVSLSSPVDKDIEVTLTPRFQNPEAAADGADLKDYIFFSTADSSVQTRPMTALQHPKVTLPANTTDIKRIYLYVLRSDKWTRGEGNQIVFTPTYDKSIVTDPKIEDEVLSTGVWILPMKPVIVTPESGADYSATAGDTVNLQVLVKDSVADSADKTVGYTVKFKPDAMTDWVTLQKKYFSTNGSLLDENGKPPVVTWYNEGSHVSKIKVVSPISGEESAEVSFTANIQPPRTVQIEFTDENGGVYTEGDEVNFRITLSEMLVRDLYAFLLPSENTNLEMFQQQYWDSFILDPSATATGNKGAKYGIRIYHGMGGTDSPVEGSFQILEGLTHGLDISFSVVLCTTEEYSEANVVSYYFSNQKTIRSYNKVPVIEDVEMNGWSIRYDLDGDGTRCPIPKNQKQEFRPRISDGQYDLTHGMQYRYTITHREGFIATVRSILTYEEGSLTAPVFSYNFPRAGIWNVKIEACDKDMGGEWSESAFEFNLEVFDQPKLLLEVADIYEESDFQAVIKVGTDRFLSDYYLAVLLTVTAPEGTNPGRFQLNGATKKGDYRYPNLPDDTATGPNQYYVFLKSEELKEIAVSAMDGTRLSESLGFTIEAKVLGDESGTDGIYSAIGEKWSDYYLPATEKVYVMNSRPQLVGATVENTEAWKVAGNVATDRPIHFMISDVEADLKGTTEFPGIKVKIMGCESGTITTSETVPTNPMEFYVTKTSSYTFTPDFGYAVQGAQTVVLMIEDKDGGHQILTYLYDVTQEHTVENPKIVFQYMLEGMGATITGCNVFPANAPVTSLDIPAVIDGRAVTKIGDFAFAGFSDLTSVKIPNGVTGIGESAFEDCVSLTSVTLPDSVADIGDWAFAFCESLKKMIISENVAHIGNFAFCECTSLRLVVFEGTPLKSVDSSTFPAVKGHYPSNQKSKWLAVIDEDGMWHNLTMTMYDNGEEIFNGATVDGVMYETVAEAVVAAISTNTIEVAEGKSVATKVVDGVVTLEIDGVKVEGVAEYYTPKVEGQKVTLGLNEKATPVFGEAIVTDENNETATRPAIEVAEDGTFKLTVKATYPTLWYRLMSTESLSPVSWRVDKTIRGRGTAERLSSNPANGGRFFKVEVFDYDPQ